MSKKLTVIVPSYNSEDTIKKCLDSLLNQSYTSFDVYVVDDGSTDGTKEMVQKYVVNNDSIYLFCKENGGPGSARNYGLKFVKTPYVTFVDSDDFVSSVHLEKMMDQFVKYPQIDMSVCGYYIMNEKGNIKSKTKLKSKILSSENAINKVFVDNSIACYSCNKIYKMNIIREKNIHFPEDIYVAEDTVFVITYLLNCRNVMVNNNRTYYYVRYKGTISEVLSIDSEFDIRGLTVLSSYDEILRILPSNYIKAINSVCAYKAWEATHIIRHLYYLKVSNDKQTILDQMFNIANKNKYKFYKSDSFSLKRKIMFFLVLNSPRLFNNIFLLLKR